MHTPLIHDSQEHHRIISASFRHTHSTSQSHVQKSVSSIRNIFTHKIHCRNHHLKGVHTITEQQPQAVHGPLRNTKQAKPSNNSAGFAHTLNSYTTAVQAYLSLTETHTQPHPPSKSLSHINASN